MLKKIEKKIETVKNSKNIFYLFRIFYKVFFFQKKFFPPKYTNFDTIFEESKNYFL